MFQFSKKGHKERDFFQVKHYRTELISEHLVYWWGPKKLPTNNQYKSLDIFIFFGVLNSFQTFV